MELLLTRVSTRKYTVEHNQLKWLLVLQIFNLHYLQTIRSKLATTINDGKNKIEALEEMLSKEMLVNLNVWMICR